MNCKEKEKEEKRKEKHRIAQKKYKNENAVSYHLTQLKYHQNKLISLLKEEDNNE